MTIALRRHPAPREVPLLARVSGRDPETLAECPPDVLRESASLGAALLVASAAHLASMTAALIILNTPPPLAAAVGATTAAGLFHADRVAIRAADMAKAEVSVRRIDAADTPRLTGRFSRVVGRLLRVAFAVTTSIVLASMVSLTMFQSDAEAVIAKRQLDLDAPLLTKATASLEAERAALRLAREQADAALRRATAGIEAAERARLAEIGRLEAQAERLAADLDDRRRRMEAARREAARQRDVASCELTGAAPGCEAASGVPGDGPRHRLAVARAEAAEAEADRLGAEVRELETARVAILEALELARRATTATDDPALPDLERRARRAAEALAVFEAAEASRAGTLAAENPARRVLDPDSLAERISALAELARDPAFLMAMLGIKAVALAIDLLAIITAAMVTPSEYALRRGEKLAGLASELRDQRRRRHVDTAELRAALRRAQRAEANDEITDRLFAGATAAAARATQPTA